jgi:hypothetical protein
MREAAASKVKYQTILPLRTVLFNSDTVAILSCESSVFYRLVSKTPRTDD